MIDGKVANFFTKSSQKCFVCGALPKEMNDIERVINRSVNKNTLQFGLQPLHAQIRCFEYIFHIAYRIDIKKWAITE